MEKERAVRCVPAEIYDRLSALAEKLWSENDPASVQLKAILEEFEPDIRTLGQITREYEMDRSGRLSARDKEYARQEADLKEKARSLEARLEMVEKEKADLARMEEELRLKLNESEARLIALQSKAVEDERKLNLKYVAKMQELYERTNELDLLAKWEEKNRNLDARIQALEEDYAARLNQLELREKALEEDVKARKAELIKTFDRIKADLDAKANSLTARERALAYWEKTGANGEGGGK